MNLEILSNVTALVGFLVWASFCIYKYTSQNKKYSEK